MATEPYASARRVFWVVDNGSSHAGRASMQRLEGSWSQRKALTPNDFSSLDELAERLLAFGRRYRKIARPFEWTFRRCDLNRVLERISDQESDLRLAA